MLCSVDARSRLLPQAGEKMVLPKGFEGDVRWGIEPALRRESRAEVSLGVRTVGLELLLEPVSLDSIGANTDALKGLVTGVGLELLVWDSAGLLKPEPPPAGNLEGTVPARALRVGLKRLFSAGGVKSGKPSWLGDSGIVSLKGVDPPLAGGPQTGVSPSWACISRALDDIANQRNLLPKPLCIVEQLTSSHTACLQARAMGNRPPVSRCLWH